ncbi:unnamed protein product, partial [marine sediment metagenome]
SIVLNSNVNLIKNEDFEYLHDVKSLIKKEDFELLHEILFKITF